MPFALPTRPASRARWGVAELLRPGPTWELDGCGKILEAVVRPRAAGNQFPARYRAGP